MFKKILELPSLIATNLIVSIKGFFEFCKVIWFYYPNKSFRRSDISLIFSYLTRSPYRIHKQYMKDQNKEDLYLYGETYLTTLDKLIQIAKIYSEDTYVELGCGRARTCFWVRCFKNCTTVGLDYVPTFIEKANSVVSKLNLDKITFVCQDFLQAEWPQGTVYYLDGTLLEGEEIASIIVKADKLPSGTRFICINFSLVGDFPAERPQWETLENTTVKFLWGEAEAGIFKKVN